MYIYIYIYIYTYRGQDDVGPLFAQVSDAKMMILLRQNALRKETCAFC